MIKLIRLYNNKIQDQDNNIQSQIKLTQLVDDDNQQSASMKNLLISSFQLGFSFLFENSQGLIILIFINQYVKNLDAIAGFGLGVVYTNCLGLSLYFGLSTGFEILASHAYGAKKYQLVGLLLNKCFFIAFIMFIPICFCMIFSKYILHIWNKNEMLCEYSRQYCITQIPGIIFLATYFIFKGYLNAQNEYRSQFYISAMNYPFIFLYSYIFIGVLDLGVYGAAITFNLSRFQNLILLFIFIKRKPSLQRCQTSFSRQAFLNNWDFLKTVIPIGAIVSADWVIYEVQSGIASNLKQSQYAAHLSLSNFNTSFFCFALGYSIGSSTYVGNEMGQKKHKISQIIWNLWYVYYFWPHSNYMASFGIFKKIICFNANQLSRCQ
ncbi:MatE efflux family protein, putative [Ichthyophthirius multifiliis]|uniref:MatE efflux family protein, putative n=1 Tax=Ichthyophthirius multifiliis TaxID=5932 RepID=G0QZQ3_ICHMU|nr:MatE efflux family protein, putative [Ichthyophthirius multifiliis]EGR29292.1 MatE efflux family protein, putative [Ichthyophthirius multifiliis]|eukprot:XP_004030528.1 MatE efflux family protein, putative [Ichthyophthirius multifiliis]